KAASHKIRLAANQARFKVGDRLVITCQVDREGYLNILNLGPGDRRPVVLFPNRLHPDNRVFPGQQITIPAPGDGFRLTAKPPRGRNLVVVFHTRENINAFRDGQGSPKDLFKTLSVQLARGFVVEQEERGDYFGAGMVQVVIE
ncbi:MAG: DUF4384 domain-containing protein, partial [Deltaproteobacteria bacterium]|nr:DUF4384 domain-containing protein [Deltaproteobacteria bacterium]